VAESMRGHTSPPTARLVVALAGVLLAATGCSSLQGTGDKGFVTGDGTVKQVAVADRGAAVSFSGKGLDGETLSLASLRGKPTVVVVFGAWCTLCRADAPLLVEAHKSLGAKANFVGIYIRDPSTSYPKAFNADFGITWPAFYSPGGKALLAFPGLLTPNTIPATVVLDAEGRPAASIPGALPSYRTLVDLVHEVDQGATHG
jgi:thiol-disulfide isomerase/thioredoxin